MPPRLLAVVGRVFGDDFHRRARQHRSFRRGRRVGQVPAGGAAVSASRDRRCRRLPRVRARSPSFEEELDPVGRQVALRGPLDVRRGRGVGRQALRVVVDECLGRRPSVSVGVFRAVRLRVVVLDEHRCVAHVGRRASGCRSCRRRRSCRPAIVVSSCQSVRVAAVGGVRAAPSYSSRFDVTFTGLSCFSMEGTCVSLLVPERPTRARPGRSPAASAVQDAADVASRP